MRVISVKIPEIVNHKKIEISDVLPPTKVSSNASLTKYKMIPLYDAQIKKNEEVKAEIKSIDLVEIFKIYQLFEKSLNFEINALISPSALRIIELNSSF